MLFRSNGAGKSTLIKILSGVYVPDEGTVLVDGNVVQMGNPRDAAALGIETVYQDLALAPDLDAASNVFLGRELRRFRVFHDQGEMRRRTAARFRELGVIANEMQKVLPEVVMEGDDGLLHVAYGNVISVLINAINELSARVEKLEG